MSNQKNIILSINVVEPGLVRAVNLLSTRLKQDLKGLVLVDKDYANQQDRPTDDSGLFEEVICDFNNPSMVANALRPYKTNLLAVTCRYEEAIQPFSKIIPFIDNINTPAPESLHWSTNKLQMRDKLREYDSHLVPKYFYVDSSQHITTTLEKIKDFVYPLITKPTGLSKSLLVNKCNTEAELKTSLIKTFEVIKQVYDREQYPDEPGVLIEEMMTGRMYSADAYAMPDGRVICLPLVEVITANSIGLPGFYGYERNVPVDNLSEAEIIAGQRAAKAAVKALNLCSTTAHIELYYTPKGWKIIELAARVGGYRDILYREAYGIEHFCNDLLIRMGREPILPSKAIGNVSVLNFYPDHEGYISSINNVHEAEHVSSAYQIDVKAKPGDLSLFSSRGGNPIVEAILSNKDKQRLKRDADSLRQLIKIDISA